MATMNTVVEQVDRMRPNVYTDEDKYRWLGDLEGLIAREVRGEDTPAPQVPKDADGALSVGYPFEDIYPLYVAAMMDFANREYDHYNNSLAVFQERYEQYKAWYIRNHGACRAKNFRNVMG